VGGADVLSVRGVGKWALITAALTGGCSEQVRQREIAGEYLYQCDDPLSLEPKWDEHRWNRVVLRQDGSYLATQPVRGPASTQEEGRWTLENYGGRPGVFLGTRGYPVRLRPKEIRLVINDDLSQWFAKAR
jgi:hypothetical protein